MTRYTIAESALSRRFDDRTLLIYDQGQRSYVLDEVGTLIWETMRSTSEMDGLAAAVTLEYEIDAETARGDISELLDELVGLGLVVAR